MLPETLRADSLARHMSEHNYHARSVELADLSLRQGFPRLCAWRLDCFQRQYLEQATRKGREAEGLAWTRRQRKLRRQLVRSLPWIERGNLKTALEVWCISVSSQQKSQAEAIERLNKNFSGS